MAQFTPDWSVVKEFVYQSQKVFAAATVGAALCGRPIGGNNMDESDRAATEGRPYSWCGRVVYYLSLYQSYDHSTRTRS